MAQATRTKELLEEVERRTESRLVAPEPSMHDSPSEYFIWVLRLEEATPHGNGPKPVPRKNYLMEQFLKGFNVFVVDALKIRESDITALDRMMVQMKGRVERWRHSGRDSHLGAVDQINLRHYTMNPKRTGETITKGKPRKSKEARREAYLVKKAAEDLDVGPALAQTQPDLFARVLPVGQKWCDVACEFDSVG
jgi:hypothetical protein